MRQFANLKAHAFRPGGERHHLHALHLVAGHLDAGEHLRFVEDLVAHL